jgi:hypothetical protein
MDFVVGNGTGNLPGTKAKVPQEFTGIDANTAAGAVLGNQAELFMRVFPFHW